MSFISPLMNADIAFAYRKTQILSMGLNAIHAQHPRKAVNESATRR